jgi:hypothetical protein
MKDCLRLRTWAGPVTIGSFVAVAFTGILMFFHLNTGLMKLAHEWMSWLLVLGVIAHLIVNWKPFLRYFTRPAAIGIMMVLFLLGALSALPQGRSGGHRHPLAGAFMALEESSLHVVAQVVKRPSDSLLKELQARNVRVRDAEQTIREIAAENNVRSMDILGPILNKPQQSPGDRT